MQAPHPTRLPSPHLQVPEQAGEPRFRGDWIDARLVLGRGTVRVLAGGLDRTLVPDDFRALAASVPEGGRARVQFNPDLGRLLVPGGHARGGRSFFRLAPAVSRGGA